MSTTVGDDFPVQQARVRAIMQEYRSLPDGAGMLAALLMEQALQRADRAILSGDLVEILRSYNELVGFEL